MNTHTTRTGRRDEQIARRLKGHTTAIDRPDRHARRRHTLRSPPYPSGAPVLVLSLADKPNGHVLRRVQGYYLSKDQHSPHPGTLIRTGRVVRDRLGFYMVELDEYGVRRGNPNLRVVHIHEIELAPCAVGPGE